jgi:hypothetical protein
MHFFSRKTLALCVLTLLTLLTMVLLDSRTIPAYAATHGTSVVSQAAAPVSAAARCGVSGGKLWCTNRVSPVYDKPSTILPPSTQIDTLRTTYSYFLCWSEGQYHQGGNDTWYKTVGDDHGRTGWVPAYKLDTTSTFDSNPSNYGLSKCQYHWG